MSIKNGKKLAALVEQYGEGDELEKKGKTLKKEVAEKIKAALDIGDSGTSEHFIADCKGRANRTLDRRKVHKRIGTTRYIEIAPPSITKLTDIIGAEGVDKLTTEITEVKTISVKRIKK